MALTHEQKVARANTKDQLDDLRFAVVTIDGTDYAVPDVVRDWYLDGARTMLTQQQAAGQQRAREAVAFTYDSLVSGRVR